MASDNSVFKWPVSVSQKHQKASFGAIDLDAVTEPIKSFNLNRVPKASTTSIYGIIALFVRNSLTASLRRFQSEVASGESLRVSSGDFSKGSTCVL